MRMASMRMWWWDVGELNARGEPGLGNDPAELRAAFPSPKTNGH